MKQLQKLLTLFTLIALTCTPLFIACSGSGGGEGTVLLVEQIDPDQEGANNNGNGTGEDTDGDGIPDDPEYPWQEIPQPEKTDCTQSFPATLA